MKMRKLGNTGMMVSEIGLGAWQLANPDWKLDNQDEALRIVKSSLDAGCNFFDTAPGYGGGRSEELLGKGLKGRRQDVIICSKFSHVMVDGARREFDPSDIRSVLEGSFRRLGTDYLDVLLLHNPPRELMDGVRAPGLYRELEALKKEGKIRAYGVSLDWAVELERVARTTASTAAEVMYNALYLEPETAFPEAAERGIGLIVKVPLDSGWLSGRYDRQTRFDDIRKRWSPEVIDRRFALVEKLKELLEPGETLARLALQFCLARSEVSTVIPGAKTVEQALGNFAAAEHELPAETVKKIRELWANEIVGSPLPW